MQVIIIRGRLPDRGRLGQVQWVKVRNRIKQASDSDQETDELVGELLPEAKQQSGRKLRWTG